MRAHGLFTALVVVLASPVLAEERDAQQTQPTGDQPQQETQVAQAQPPAPPATPPPTSPPAPPPSAAPPSPFTFAFRGFISGSVFVQDGITAGAAGLTGGGGTTGLGQGAFLGVSEEPTDKLLFGGDVRQTRLNFSMKGPQILFGATPTGVVELDFFGGFSGGSFGDESVFPRLRLAYVDLAWSETTLRVGQFHNLLVGFIPASAAHIGNPFVATTYVGWRSPGITLLQKVPVGGMNLELGVQANRNTWQDTLPACTATLTTGCLPGGISAAEASGSPQLQARVALTSGNNPSPWPLYPTGDFTFFVAGEWDQKDVSGYGISGGEAFTTYAVQAAAKVNVGPLVLAASGFLGQNTGGLIGNIAQFAPLTGEDVFDLGGWAQVGVSLTKEWSLWATFGTSRPNQEDAEAANFARRFQNVYAAMLAYKDGPYAVGLEWIQWMTGLAPLPPPAPAREPANINQGIATVTYFF